MIILYVVACSACFSFGAIFMAIFCAAGRADEHELLNQQLMDQNARQAKRLLRIYNTRTTTMAHNHRKCVQIAAGVIA